MISMAAGMYYAVAAGAFSLVKKGKREYVRLFPALHLPATDTINGPHRPAATRMQIILRFGTAKPLL